MENTKAFTRIANITNPYFEAERELVKRVEFVKTVIQNTLRKFPTTVWPKELEWTRGGGRITGFEFRDSKGNVVTDVQNGTAPITHGHTLHFYVIKRKFFGSDMSAVAVQASIPASLLFNDPMAIAQYARKLIRQEQSRIRMEQISQTNKKMQELEAQLKKLEVQRAQLEKEAEDSRRKVKQARESADKTRAKQEKRRAAKLLKTES